MLTDKIMRYRPIILHVKELLGFPTIGRRNNRPTQRPRLISKKVSSICSFKFFGAAFTTRGLLFHCNKCKSSLFVRWTIECHLPPVMPHLVLYCLLHPNQTTQNLTVVAAGIEFRSRIVSKDNQNHNLQ